MKKSIQAKTIITILLSIVLCTTAFSQEETISKDDAGGRGFFMLGWSMMNLDELNTKLENRGYSKLSDNFISFGGIGYGMIGSILLGGHGNALSGKEIVSGVYKTSMSAAYGFFDLGYLLYSDGAINVYPLIGIGGGSMSLKIFENKILSFDEILDNPKRSVELSTGGFLINAALGADYLFQLGEDERGKGGIAVGIRAGYIFAPLKGDWKMNEIEITGSPNLGITGPYIQFMIGGGGFSKR
ncbi:MAG: hypothetical protein FJ213_07515 [Ignavibacteria bacterium]|nr:hypothetical protein [Ignavibacteria bacterium]